MLQNVPHQIIQSSPARLGLPNPNSPSLQPPAPPKFPSQVSQSQQPNLHPNLLTTPTSLTLLPLLPPLSRAQSILLRMGSLATKLFEVSPNATQWLATFHGSFPKFLPTQSVNVSGSAPGSAKEIVALFATLQGQLFEAVTELQEILDLQDAKQKVTREIRARDAAILAFANKLKEAERVLDMLVDDYSDFRRLKRLKGDDGEEGLSTTTVATQLNLNDILSYAHRISYTTFAPPEFGAGTAPLRGALPPAPQEEQMRASQLYAFADLDVGLPPENKDKFTIEPLAENPLDANPLANMGIMDMLPPNIVVPSGWKPGMPVQLPTDLSILPPAGWKPGDPVALPSLDSLDVPPRIEDQQPQPAHVPGFARGPQPIQVRHVQLDIGADSSSEYSSDDDTSDDED
uniref:Mediator of RNA polymerase II transcription subunit 4 n=1 Tax=Tanacetum cinerariifolium TaxID=118510 RepID=A0A699GP00_TANCI|nr:mediator of RNA polymerase II transcription subunit 4-like [Tanacetum cinerariifolium]